MTRVEFIQSSWQLESGAGGHVGCQWVGISRTDLKSALLVGGSSYRVHSRGEIIVERFYASQMLAFQYKRRNEVKSKLR